MKECPTCCRCFPDNLNHCPTDGEGLRFTIMGDTTLDSRYQLESRLGQGGMGIVYKGRHVFLKTQHAIKIILPDLVGNDPSLVTRFRQEAMAAAAIRHPNIVGVTDFGVVNETTPFLVMEFLEGRSLHELLVEEGRIDTQRAVEIMLAVASGVAAAHRQGIVHRDLKPLNVMLLDGTSAREGVKILDFGLAKIKSGDLLGSFVAAKTQGLMGSPFYMAPEQWGDEEPNAQSDIYSLGVILYQMLAGDVPFKGNSIPSIMSKHLTAPPPTLAEKGATAPNEIERVIHRALEKEPEKRHESVEQFIDELRVALAASAPSLGSETSPGAGFQTVAIKEPRTVPPEAPKTHGVRTGDLASGRTNADAFARGDAASGFETVANPPDQATPDAKNSSEAPQARATARELPHAPSDARDAREKPTVRFGQTPNIVAPDAQKTQAGPLKGTRPLEDLKPASQRIPAQEGDALRAPAATSPAKRMPTAVWAAAGVLALLCVVAGLYLLMRAVSNETASNVAANSEPRPNSNVETKPTAAPFRPEFVTLPGGGFMMGRNDVPPRSGEVSVQYQAWVYNQWPAHSVNVKPFAIDRTEVTNAEYAQFVEETGFPPPPDWGGKSPIAGQELWPVRNVSAEDARRFAVWRSRRDGVEYRLPTEEEWEYAARGGDSSRMFPWGTEYVAGRANLESDSLRPVGSFPQGATPQGLQDMIGNVWEWTETEAAMYEGNDILMIAQSDRDKLVVRGGSYQSSASGDEPVTATARRWLSRDTRDPVVGFRLVRAAEGRGGR